MGFTETKRYQSKYSKDKWITPIQYIVELVCENIARKHNIELPYEFWKDTEGWGKTFKTQMVMANKLCKEYPAECIIRALSTKKGKRAYSLGAKFILEPLIREEILKQKKVDQLMFDDPLTPFFKPEYMVVQPRPQIGNNPLEGLD